MFVLYVERKKSAQTLIILHIDVLEKRPRTHQKCFYGQTEIGNPYMKDLKLDIKEEDIIDVLNLLESKGYNVSNFNA